MKHVTKKPADPKKKDGQKHKNKDDQVRNEKKTRQDAPQGLTKEDLPDATNESTGAMGSGQRQDSN